MSRRELKSRSAETLDRLLDAARVELEEVGHDALTIRTVATRAGVSTEPDGEGTTPSLPSYKQTVKPDFL